MTRKGETANALNAIVIQLQSIAKLWLGSTFGDEG